MILNSTLNLLVIQIPYTHLQLIPTKHHHSINKDCLQTFLPRTTNHLQSIHKILIIVLFRTECSLRRFFSSIFGTLVPGSIYRSQTLHFHSPVYSLDQIVASVHVKHVRVINRKMMIHDKETDLNNNNHASENHDKPSFLKGLIVKCDTQIIKILQSHDECTSNHKENNGINNKNNNLKCVSGVAEVWLPNILSHVID
mmetsp:Transcript_358/g.581  ORF Transcript_358/g.581 Transcript_358/m.581 type:complete len:198 (+) Transcript_358:592-1185(+)